LKAFQRVREGRCYLNHDLASDVAFMQAKGATDPLRRMSIRELETLALVAEGKPYGLIAEHLHEATRRWPIPARSSKLTRRAHPAGADADCHSASPPGDGKKPEIILFSLP
jgi:hypothetical protein